MTPKRLGQLLEKPLERPNPALALTRLVNLAVTARNQAFEVTTRRRFCREGADARKVGRRALKQQMKMAKLVEAHPQIRLGFKLVEQTLELNPVRPLGGEETLQINNHL